MYFYRRICSLCPRNSRMSSNLRNSSCARSENWCSTETRVDEVEFDWTINNFNLHQAKGANLESSIFSADTNNKFKWYLWCKAHGKTLYLYLCLATKITESLFVECTISRLNNNGVSTSSSTFVHEFTSRSGHGGNQFFGKDESFKKYLISNGNKLTFRCNLKFSEMKNIDTNSNQHKPKILKCNLSEDLAVLLETQGFSDIIISANGKDYKGHRAILAARSPVFAAMFRHNMTETEQNRVVIEDVNEEVVGEMLRFVYTGKCQNLGKFAKELLAAAEKYGLDRLKIICEKELCKTLSFKNAMNILVVADKHLAKDLKNEAMKIVVAKFSEVVKTTAWKDVIISNPTLAIEVCKAFGGQ